MADGRSSGAAVVDGLFPGGLAALNVGVAEFADAPRSVGVPVV